MIVSVASGKGGVGKTTVAVNLALALSQWERVRIIDADVEEPNVHVFLPPRILGHELVTVGVPKVDAGLCKSCGRCADVCAFGAVAFMKGTPLVFPELCHGCGGCSLLCPEGAVTEEPRAIGVVEKGVARGMASSQGTLRPGETLAPLVVRAAKKGADTPGQVAVIDAPPGTGCPSAEAIRKGDLCLLVTEPTVFGQSDLALAAEMADRYGLRQAVILNRVPSAEDAGEPAGGDGVGGGGGPAGAVERFCAEKGLPVIARLPDDMDLAKAQARGVPVSLVSRAWKKRFEKLAETVLGLLEEAGSCAR